VTKIHRELLHMTAKSSAAQRDLSTFSAAGLVRLMDRHLSMISSRIQTRLGSRLMRQ
jgi:hypothetical protein